MRRVSSGAGRTTCGYFTPDGKRIVYASTHAGGAACPPKPSYARGYVWPVYDSYDIYVANADGSGLKPLTTTPGYDAEATIAPDGRIVFTSVRDGDMEIYSMNGDGSDVRRLTDRVGPDGGPFWSRDGQRIVFRGRPIAPGKELDDYRDLLKQGLWRPTSLELFVMNRDGSGLRQVTKNGAANFAPYFTPDGRQIVFASNAADPRGRNFDVYLVERRRHRPGAGHLQRDVRRLPHVFAGRHQGRVRVEPLRGPRGRHERVHRRLGGVPRQIGEVLTARVLRACLTVVQRTTRVQRFALPRRRRGTGSVVRDGAWGGARRASRLRRVRRSGGWRSSSGGARGGEHHRRSAAWAPSFR